MPLLPFRKILFPTDFSDPSRKALQSAVEMAAHFSAELCLLHVSTPVPVAVSGIGAMEVGEGFDVALYQQDLMGHAKKMLLELIEREIPGELRISTIVETGDPATVITGKIEAEGIDLVVMATHGLTGLTHFFLGSVAEKVVRRAAVPVLTIRLPGKKD